MSVVQDDGAEAEADETKSPPKLAPDEYDELKEDHPVQEGSTKRNDDSETPELESESQGAESAGSIESKRSRVSCTLEDY